MAETLGIQLFLSFPIRSQERLVGVLEFFSTDEADPAPDELQLLDLVSTQIGRLIEREHARHRLTQLALHDALTGLANRVLFHDCLVDYLAGTDEKRRTVAVLLLDLDGFKEVNDSLGHAAGDELLVEVARRLEQATRRTDTVARLGGDEFAVAVRNVAADRGSRRAVARLLDALSEPFEVHGRRIRPMGRIGVALSSGDESADMLLRNADLAMHDVKAAGKGRVSYFHPAMHEEITERLDLEASFDLAVEAGEVSWCTAPSSPCAPDRWSHARRCCAGATLTVDCSTPVRSCADQGRLRSLRGWRRGLLPRSVGMQRRGGLRGRTTFGWP